MKNSKIILLTLFMSLIFIFSSCEKEDTHNHSDDHTCMENCTMDCCANGDSSECTDACADSCCSAGEERMALVEDGYIEVEVSPIVKQDCYFSNWDKTILTPVSGLFEYYNDNGDWAASIDFGDGSCDEWVTKSWNVNMFPENPEGSLTFSVFKKSKQ